MAPFGDQKYQYCNIYSLEANILSDDAVFVPGVK